MLVSCVRIPSHDDEHRCGSGLSGEQLSDEGHMWIGVDISRDMLGLLLQCVKRARLLMISRDNQQKTLFHDAS